MLAKTLGGVDENDALFGDDFLDVGVGGFGVELGFDAGEEFALLLGDAEALEGFFDVVGDFVPGAFRFLTLREVVADFLKIDILEVLRRPVRGHGHREEFFQRLEAKLEDPRCLFFDRADVADRVFAEAGAGVEGVLHVVGEITGGLVDADGGIFHGGGFGRIGQDVGFGGWLHGGGRSEAKVAVGRGEPV